MPVGFVLAAVGIVCVQAVGSADMMAVVMNAQRGSGGFIFLALPFFILAGFIMDRADVGGRIVDFVGSLIGHMRGGLLQVMVIGVYLSSCISGSKAADMATIGIPMNRKLDAARLRAARARGAARGFRRDGGIGAAQHRAHPARLGDVDLDRARCSSPACCPRRRVAHLPDAAGARARVVCRLAAHAARAAQAKSCRTGRRAILPLMMPVILIGGIVGRRRHADRGVDVRGALRAGARAALPADRTGATSGRC